MKNLLVVIISALLFVGCASLGTCSKIKGHLHQYNTKWDRFSGTLEVGQIYDYQPNYWRNNARFTAVQIIGNNNVIFYREARQRLVDTMSLVAYGEPEQIVNEAYILIETNQLYVNDSTLKKGLYICTGTYSYTTKTSETKTIYKLKEYTPTTLGQCENK